MPGSLTYSATDTLTHPPSALAANEKMMYGTRQEARALSSYQQLAPHEAVLEKGFAVWGTDNAHDWLAASPDGLITSSGLTGTALAESAGVSEEVAQWVQQQTGALGLGAQPCMQEQGSDTVFVCDYACCHLVGTALPSETCMLSGSTHLHTLWGCSSQSRRMYIFDVVLGLSDITLTA